MSVMQAPALIVSAHLQVLLLDEITVDLDVLGRADLLHFLQQECEQRKATIIYVSLQPPIQRHADKASYWACCGTAAPVWQMLTF